MEIIGRSREKEKLNQTLKSKRSELIAIYGRRRIGKTYLIREFYDKNMVFRFTGLPEGNRADQIENFMLKLNSYTFEFRKEKPKTWLEAFYLLQMYLNRIDESGQKKVVFIDEFPWVDTHKSKFLPAFENFWNDYCASRSDLVVVICGSAASYIIKNIIQNKKGLYNRLTNKIKLEPFNLQETEAFLKYKGVKMNRQEISKLYMTFGGIAEYLEQLLPGDSSVTAINRLCFQQDAHLSQEFKLVFKSLFEDHSYHERIIKVLANGKKKGVTRDEILEEMEIKSGGRFTDCLEELIQCGFIEKYEAYRNASKTALYRICDEFCLFHLQFIAVFKDASWEQLYQKQEYKTWCGYAFETICLKHAIQIKRALKCDQIESDNYAWSNDKAQIDLVIDRNDDTVNLCEVKFYKNEISLDKAYRNKLVTKEEQFQLETRTKKSLQTIMISTWGLKPNEYSDVVMKSLTMDCLYE